MHDVQFLQKPLHQVPRSRVDDCVDMRPCAIYPSVSKLLYSITLVAVNKVLELSEISA